MAFGWTQALGLAGALTNLGGAVASPLYGAHQNTLNRNFNAAEAQKAREWQLMVDSTKHQRNVTDMLAAGLNPALMYGSGSLTNGAASNAQASAGAPLGADFSGLNNLFRLAEIALRDREIELERERVGLEERNINMKEEKNIADIGLVNSQKELNEILQGLNDEQKNKVIAETKKISEETRNVAIKNEYDPQVYEAEILKAQKQVALMESDIDLKVKQGKLTEAQAAQCKANIQVMMAEIDFMGWKYAKIMEYQYAEAYDRQWGGSLGVNVKLVGGEASAKGGQGNQISERTQVLVVPSRTGPSAVYTMDSFPGMSVEDIRQYVGFQDRK